MIGAPNSLNLNCKVRVMKEAPDSSVSEEIADIFRNYNIHYLRGGVAIVWNLWLDNHNWYLSSYEYIYVYKYIYIQINFSHSQPFNNDWIEYKSTLFKQSIVWRTYGSDDIRALYSSSRLKTEHSHVNHKLPLTFPWYQKFKSSNNFNLIRFRYKND